jgi:hypothetical protein
MLTEDEKAGLAAMDRDQLGGLLGLVRKARAMFGTGCMPWSAIEDLVKAVPDEQVRAIVHDLKGGLAQPSGLLAPSSAVPNESGSGWRDGRPLEGSVPGIKYVDQLCDVQDAIDRRELAKRLGGR